MFDLQTFFVQLSLKSGDQGSVLHFHQIPYNCDSTFWFGKCGGVKTTKKNENNKKNKNFENRNS